MSFFSTADVLKSIITGDLVKSIINNPGFKQGLDKIDIKEYFSDEVIEDITKKIFSNPEIKKQLRNMIIEVLSDMGIRDEVGAIINNDSQS